MAVFIDTLIQGLIYIALIIAAAEAENLNARIGLSNTPSNWLIALVVLIVFLIFVLYFATFEAATNGQTPGKRIIGLRVVKEDGRPFTIGAALVRNLVRLIDFFPLAYSVGFVVMLCNERAKRFGDIAAGTVVIKERQVKLSDLTALTARSSANIPGAMTNVDDAASGADADLKDALRKLRESDVQLAEALLQRRYETTGMSAERAAKRLSDALAARMDLADGGAALRAQGDFAFLKHLTSAYRSRTSAV